MTSKGQTIMFKKIPALKTNQQTEDFVDRTDLSEYDLSKFKPTKFEFAAKDQRLNMRLPSSLLEAVKKKAKAKAKAKGLPYQRYIRATLEKAVGEK
jgi:predicted DNA binding CopG/RHH family protein